jgi:hypothetical protein
MKTCVSKALVPLILVAGLMIEACDSDAGGPEVGLHTATGTVTVRVEVADTPAERSFGLMYRKEMAADAGMFFVFDDMQVRSFWMRNTILPLDMIFIDARLEIVGIVHDAVPFTTTSRSVGKPSQYVLEVNAGFSAAHGVRAGDRVTVAGIAGVAAAGADREAASP